MKKINIIGSGTLAKLIVDILDSSEEYQVGGFYSDDFPSLKEVLGYPVLGKIDEISTDKSQYLAIGIGEPKYRKMFYEKYSSLGINLPSIIHKSVFISRFCIVEPGVLIGPNSSVLNGSRICKASCLLSHVNINQDVVLNPYCLIAAGVVVGNNAVLGEGCHIGLGSYVKLKQTIPPWTNYPNS